MHFSKTDVYCDCGHLQRMSEDPHCPIEFDTELNEFYLVFESSFGRSETIIYHCLFCGGKTPDSLRGHLFTIVTNEEQSRLIGLLDSVSTSDDIIAALGPPDEDFPLQLTRSKDEMDGQPPTATAQRVLVYRNLSDTAELRIDIYGNKRSGVMISGKYIGKKSDEATS